MKNGGGPLPLSDLPQHDSLRLLAAVQALSQLREIEGVVDMVRTAARELVAADGIAVILRQGEELYYAAEDAIGPLWLGQRFPMTGCISGWSMREGRTVAIEDVYDDPRINRELYQSTFVRSLAIAPIRPEDPLGALGAYWATRHEISARELALLEALAGATAVAMANAVLYHEAQEAVQVRDRFLTMAAHELRTPLASLLLQVQRLAVKASGDEPLEPGPLRGQCTVIERQVHRMEALVTTLLDVSNIVRGPLHLRPEPVELGELVHDRIADALRLHARVAPVITLSAERPVRGHWDRLRIDTVVSNLLGNAIKYGAGKPIEVTVEAADEAARLEVTDHGIGIDPRDQERIFQQFERAVSGQHYGGLGLGLWLAHRIVVAHGGSIAVHSQPGQGARFVVLLPYAPAVENEHTVST
ncbi:MAG TPA: ATP-binding protein [Polyangia bacterium]|jgi:two-component system CheB/CheR fusion protein|nr:ATP-binding protein [Polyangia bacterium]